MHDVLDLRDILADELEYATVAGAKIPDQLTREISVAIAENAVEKMDNLLFKLESIESDLGIVKNNPPVEEILDQMVGHQSLVDAQFGLSKDAIRDRIRGAWLGRCAACCMGKPVEGLAPDVIRRYLREVGSWPLRTYVPVNFPLPEYVDPLNPSWVDASRNRVDGMPRDDDLDYTILALHLVETYGKDFTSADVAREWMDKLPFLQTFTAERATYRNLVSGMSPAQAGRYRNPYVDWIGALIRVDLYGYISPGRPHEAARMAYQDASLSHTGVGVTAAMWAAALVSIAFSCSTAQGAVRKSLEWTPDGSRLQQSIQKVVDSYDAGESWSDVISWLDDEFRGHSWVHSVNNAVVITAALMWGEDQLDTSAGLAVQAGLDTDSSAATVGSVIGALHGRGSLPAHLVEPLHDKIASAVRGFDGISITELARRTAVLAGVDRV